MGVGGEAKEVVFPKSLKELKEAVACPRFFIIGNGSNIIASDEGYSARIICTKELRKIKYSVVGKDVFLFCEAGVNLFELNRLCAKNNFGGLEFSYGIPGSVGGAVRMNAGAFGGQMSDVVEYVQILENGRLKRIKKFDFSYRHSGLEDKIIYSVGLKLKLSQGVKERQENYLNERKAKQPYAYRSAGSVFKRTGELIPAQIIDKLGLKGVKRNGAEISKVHAGFIVNNGGAKASDIKELIALIKEKVKAKTGVELIEEVVYLE